jgi:hypothetical protein
VALTVRHQGKGLQNYATGIDDIATMNGTCSGWTIVSFDCASFSDFEVSAGKILETAKLKSFHGKEFKRKKFDSYVEFLKLIRTTLEAGEGFVSCTLLGQDWKSEFEKFCDDVIGGSFSSAGIDAESITEASKRIAAPLFTYQRLAAAKCQGGNTLIHIDRHALIDSLNDFVFELEGTKLSGQLPIIAVLRAYGRSKFPNAPEIDRESIVVCTDESSFLVQAADIIGNFSSALAFRHLGKKSKSNDLKCSAFEQAFGDIIDLSTFPDSVVQNGDDLALAAGSASFTFSIGGTGA